MNTLPPEAIDAIEKKFYRNGVDIYMMKEAVLAQFERTAAHAALTDPSILAAAGLYTQEDVNRMVELAKHQALTDPKVYEPAGLVNKNMYE